MFSHILGKFRHLPVVENGEVIAMLDIAKCLYVPVHAAAAGSAGAGSAGSVSRGYCSTFNRFQPEQCFSLTQPATTVFWLLFSDKRTGHMNII